MSAATMKFFITIFCIVVMVEYSSAGACLGCAKRDDNDPLIVFHKFKAYAEDVQPIIKAVIQDIPTTPGYSKYKQSLENYLKRVEQKTVDMCFEKVFRNCGEFVELLEPYQKDGAPAEAKEVLKLFMKHGYKEFSEKQVRVFKNVDMEKFVYNVSMLNSSDEDMKKYKEITEQC